MTLPNGVVVISDDEEEVKGSTLNIQVPGDPSSTRLGSVKVIDLTNDFDNFTASKSTPSEPTFQYAKAKDAISDLTSELSLPSQPLYGHSKQQTRIPTASGGRGTASSPPVMDRHSPPVSRKRKRSHGTTIKTSSGETAQNPNFLVGSSAPRSKVVRLPLKVTTLRTMSAERSSTLPQKSMLVQSTDPCTNPESSKKRVSTDNRSTILMSELEYKKTWRTQDSIGVLATGQKEVKPTMRQPMTRPEYFGRTSASQADNSSSLKGPRKQDSGSPTHGESLRATSARGLAATLEQPSTTQVVASESASHERDIFKPSPVHIASTSVPAEELSNSGFPIGTKSSPDVQSDHVQRHTGNYSSSTKELKQSEPPSMGFFTRKSTEPRVSPTKQPLKPSESVTGGATNDHLKHSILSLAELTNVLKENLRENRQQHESLNHAFLKDARQLLETKIASEASDLNKHAHRLNPFESMRAAGFHAKLGSNLPSSTREEFQLFHQDVQRALKCDLPDFAVPVITLHVDAPQVPKYATYTRLQINQLSENDKDLKYLPYFSEREGGEKNGLYRELKARFHDRTNHDGLKRELTQKAEALSLQVNDFLRQIGIAVTDLLYYLLNPELVLPDVSIQDSLATLWLNRNPFSDDTEDFDTQHWHSLFDILHRPTDRNYLVAGLACHTFQQTCKFSIWHVISQAKETIKLMADKIQFKGQKMAGDVLCSVCHM